MPAALQRDGPSAAAARGAELDRRVRPRPGARRAVGPRRSARPASQRRARADRAADGCRSGRDQQRALRHARHAGRWRPHWPRCAPAARSTRSTVGCPPRSFAHLRAPARAGSALRALAGSGRAHGRHRARVRVRPEARGAASCPTIPCPTGHTEMTWLRELVRRGAADRLPGARTGSTTQALRQIDYELSVIEQLGFPGYFLLLHDIVEFCRRSATSTARGGGARRTARSVTRSVSPRPTRSRSACCSNGSCHPNATVRPTSTSTSSTNAAKR